MLPVPKYCVGAYDDMMIIATIAGCEDNAKPYTIMCLAVLL